MKKGLFILLLVYTTTAYSQQESTIKIDSGSKNDISVTQASRGDSQKSNIDIKKGGGNKIKLSQKMGDSTSQQKAESKGFNSWITNTNNIFVLLISVGTLIGLIWKGIPYIKKLIGRP